MQQYPAVLGTYSSTNFVVADFIAEQVTGRPITELVQEYIFVPMNFTSTVLLDRLSDGIHPDPAATPYAGVVCVTGFAEFGFPGLENGVDMTLISRGITMAGTAGAVNSEIYDLLAWAKSGTGDDLLSPETVVRRHDYSQMVGGSLMYGIAQYVLADFITSNPGIGLEHFKGWAGHSGGAFGFTARAFHNAELGASFAIGINSCAAGSAIDNIMKLFNDELLTRSEFTETPIPDEPTASPTGETSSTVMVSVSSMVLVATFALVQMV